MKPPRHNPPSGHPIDPARWLSALPDDLPICDINIPGSHNAAAINTVRPTRWACQRHSITEQLQKGIRLLDIRLKPKRRRHGLSTPGRESRAPSHEFITCHGHLGPFGANEFQSLESLLEECTAFLQASPKETIIMTMQIDDWRKSGTKAHPQILKALKARLTRLPLIITPKMPALKDCRGRIFLINRINDDPALGVPIDIPDNTPGTMLHATAQRQYEVYIQDQYKKLNKKDPEAHKFRLTIEAQEKNPKGSLLLNFASATKPFGRFVYINEDLLQYFTVRPPLGWLLLDYPFDNHATSQAPHRQATPDLPTLIITSNYHP